MNKHYYQAGEDKMKKINNILTPRLLQLALQIALPITLIISAAGLTSCDKKEEEPPPPKVTVSKPATAEITPYLYETGNTVAINTIDLVARVSGYLDSYNFIDGSMVQKGDLLFVIQPEPYANDLAEAQSTLDANMAEYTYDKTEYARQLEMYKRKATPLSDVQQWQSTTEAAAANVQGAQANVDNAGITYSYTRVFAPMSGRIGRHLVDPGNLVGNGEATELASIEQISPIYVYFSINELDLLKIRKIARQAGFKPAEINQIPIEIALQNEEKFPHKGHLDFASAELEASTGTIQMRGILPNQDTSLLPGLFAKVRIALSKPSPQLTLPSTAILYDQVGAYVFTVGDDNKVAQTRVKTGSIELDNIVVLQGLRPNDLVIIDGLQNATPGGEVTATEKSFS